MDLFEKTEKVLRYVLEKKNLDPSEVEVSMESETEALIYLHTQGVHFWLDVETLQPRRSIARTIWEKLPQYTLYTTHDDEPHGEFLYLNHAVAAAFSLVEKEHILNLVGAHGEAEERAEAPELAAKYL